MPTITYSEKLRDPRWQKKRLEIMSRSEFTCDVCESKDRPLHVHHRLYQRNTDPWDYPPEIYSVLCEDCHKDAESIKLGIDQILSEYPIYVMVELLEALREISDNEKIGPIKAWGKWIGFAHKLKNNHVR